MSDTSNRKPRNTEDEEQEDYIDDAHPEEDREDAVADEQGEESSRRPTHCKLLVLVAALPTFRRGRPMSTALK